MCMVPIFKGGMVVKLKLIDILHIIGPKKWCQWCSERDVNIWACAEGYGDQVYSISINEAAKYGLINWRCNMENIRTEVKHSKSKNAWNVIGTQIGKKYKIAIIPYQVVLNNEVLTTFNKHESMEHALFISRCFNELAN
jgi:hypothetical protein